MSSTGKGCSPHCRRDAAGGWARRIGFEPAHVTLPGAMTWLAPWRKAGDAARRQSWCDSVRSSSAARR
jgi:hypothetical protein